MGGRVCVVLDRMAREGASVISAGFRRAVAIAGCSVTAAVIVYVRVAEHVAFELLDRFDIVFEVLVVGVVVACAGMIASARLLDRFGRVKMAGLVLVVPWTAILLDSFVEEVNVHGASMPVYMLVLFTSLMLALVLGVMAIRTHTPNR